VAWLYEAGTDCLTDVRAQRHSLKRPCDGVDRCRALFYVSGTDTWMRRKGFMDATQIQDWSYPRTVGTRLYREDGEKLLALVAHFQMTPCAVLRLLVRTATPTNMPPVLFGGNGAQHAPDDEQTE
jgi:hypothetical protein